MPGRKVRLAQVLCHMSEELATTECIKRLDHTLYVVYNQQRNKLAEENHFVGAIHRYSIQPRRFSFGPEIEVGVVWVIPSIYNA